MRDVGLLDAQVIATVMGPPTAVRTSRESHGPMLCAWNHPDLREYEMPATKELVIALQTSGGGARMRVGRGWSPVALPGSVHVVPPEMSTRWRIDGGLGFLSVHVATERIDTLIARGGDESVRMRDFGFRFAVRDPFLSAAARELARELAEPKEKGSLYTDVLADGMILRVLRLGGEASRQRDADLPAPLSDKQLAVVRDRIEDSLERGVTLAELAGIVGLSRFHFARAFKAATGTPPHRYVTMRRIERAKVLLRDAERSLVEVALEVGFSSQSHFTRRFHELTGMTPLRYRNDLR